jgi:hypothetical protein
MDILAYRLYHAVAYSLMSIETKMLLIKFKPTHLFFVESALLQHRMDIHTCEICHVIY